MSHHHTAPILVISGSIGSGKGTIVHALCHELDLHWIKTHTTRPMRKDDTVLSRRVYDTEDTFARHEARGEFFEFIELHDHRYGVLKTDIHEAMHQNRAAIIEMNVDGGVKLAKEYPNAFLVFLTAPEQTRRERIFHRAMGEDDIEDRMKEARREEKIAKKEYHYLVENVEDHPQEAIEAIKSLLKERFGDDIHKPTAS